MPDDTEPQTPSVTEKRLRQLLVSRKTADHATLDAWLARDPEEAAGQLAQIARQTIPVWRLRKMYLSACLVSIAGWTASVLMMHLLWDKALADASYSGCGIFIAGAVSLAISVNTGRGGSEAALLLADTKDDRRAVRRLASLWIPNPWTVAQAKRNTAIRDALTRLLTQREGQRYDGETETALRELLKRAFPRRSRVARWLHRLRPVPDLTEADTDLLLTVTRHLGHNSPLNSIRYDAEGDETAIRHAAEGGGALAQGEHRVLLRDTAQTLLTVSAQKRTP